MTTTTLKEGDQVRFIGQTQEPGNGSVGTFAWLQDYDVHCGEPRGWAPGFIDASGNGYYVELNELELV